MKKVKFTKEYIHNPETATYKKLIELDEKIDIQKGDKGNKGDKPIAGVDYKIPENGKDGKTPIKGKDYFDGKDGKDGIGKEGREGENGSPDTPKDIANKLNTLKEAVEIKVIKGLEKKLIDKTTKKVVKEIPKNKVVEKYIQRVAGGGGASWFTQLNDTPNDYTGQIGKFTLVNDDEDGLKFSTGEGVLNPLYVRRDGTTPLTANWNAGNFKITAKQFQSSIADGTAPLIVASKTKVVNLNADLLDGQHGTYYVDIVNDTTPQLGGTLDCLENPIDNVGNITHHFVTPTDWEIYNQDEDKDTIYYVNKGGSKTEVFRLDGSTGYLAIGKDTADYPIDLKLSITTNPAGQQRGGNFLYETNNTAPDVISQTGSGFRADYWHSGSGNMTGIGEGFVSNAFNLGTGDVTELRGGRHSIGLTSSGNIALGKGLQIGIPFIANGGVIALNYGLYIENQQPAGVTKGYGIYIEGDTDNYIAGNLGIGTPTPQAQLHTTKGRIVKVDRYTSTTTLTADNHQVFGDTDGGAFTINLPAGVEGTYYRIVNTGGSANNLTITPNGLELLSGVNGDFTLGDDETLIIVYHPTDGWR